MDEQNLEFESNINEGFVRIKKSYLSDMGISDFGTFDECMEDSVVEPVFDPYDEVSVKRRLLWAAQNNRIDILKEILEDPKQDQTLFNNTFDEDGYTPLHRACYNGHTEVVKYLIAHGANIRAKTNDGWEPIHCACFWSNYECLSLLLNASTAIQTSHSTPSQAPRCHIINALTHGGLTPLHLACQNNASRETLEILLLHPALNPMIKTPQGDTGKDIALRKNVHAYLFEMLEPSINSLYEKSNS